MTFYDSISEWYDEIFPVNNNQAEFVKFVFENLKEKQLADIGCGTGNLCLLLAPVVKHITGVDPDQGMLEIANTKGKAYTNTKFIRADMLQTNQLFSASSLDGLLCIGNTLVHLSNTEEMRLFFLQSTQVLKPRGKIIIQIINYDHILSNKVENLPIIENENIRFIRKYEIQDFDKPLVFATRLIVKETGKEFSNRVVLYPLRKKQLNNLLLQAGFKNLEFYGDFSGNPLHDKSISLIVKAQL